MTSLFHRQAGSVPRLAMRGISKRFPGTLANDSVDLTVYPGEIHALLGENGAGKSTLMKLIYGLLRPDAGQLYWQGGAVTVDSPSQARRLGVGMVFQHFALFDTLTVAENILLTQDKGRLRSIAGLEQSIACLSEAYGLAVDPKRRVYTLSTGERQRVEIVRALLGEPDLLILDEPTSVLTPQEIERLFIMLRRLSDEGRSILFISHKLNEVRALCHAATVLRAGRVVGHCKPAEESARSLACLMVGHAVSERLDKAPVTPGEPVLAVRGLALPSGQPYGVDLQRIDLQVQAGEIVGIAGVAGNGQTELLAALSGLRTTSDDAAIRLRGQPVGQRAIIARRRLGLAYVPEERLGTGAVPDMDLIDNAMLTPPAHAIGFGGYLRRARIRAWAQRICQSFGVKQAGLRSLARELSGGNLQKFIMGREMLQTPKLLIAAHPTWGVDVNAAAGIYQALIEMRNAGTAVLIVSEDLDELFILCDRVGALYAGRLSAVKALADTNRQEVGAWMGGATLGAGDEQVVHVA